MPRFATLAAPHDGDSMVKARWATTLGCLVLALAPASSALAGQSAANVPGDYSSIFADVPALVDAGWSKCVEPIGWSADTSQLTPSQSQAQLANLQFAFSAWSNASGLTFQFDGTTRLRLNERQFTLTPANGAPVGTRSILIDFVPAGASKFLSRTTVGQASPSSVLPAPREIVMGTVVLSANHSARSTVRAMRSLMLHEIGHVLGLAHAQSASNVMSPVVGDRVRLGAGDIEGIRALVKPCVPKPAQSAAGPEGDTTVVEAPPVTVPPVTVPPLTVPPVGFPAPVAASPNP